MRCSASAANKAALLKPPSRHPTRVGGSKKKGGNKQKAEVACPRVFCQRSTIGGIYIFTYEEFFLHFFLPTCLVYINQTENDGKNIYDCQ